MSILGEGILNFRGREFNYTGFYINKTDSRKTQANQGRALADNVVIIDSYVLDLKKDLILAKFIKGKTATNPILKTYPNYLKSYFTTGELNRVLDENYSANITARFLHDGIEERKKNYLLLLNNEINKLKWKKTTLKKLFLPKKPL